MDGENPAGRHRPPAKANRTFPQGPRAGDRPMCRRGPPRSFRISRSAKKTILMGARFARPERAKREIPEARRRAVFPYLMDNLGPPMAAVLSRRPAATSLRFAARAPQLGRAEDHPARRAERGASRPSNRRGISKRHHPASNRGHRALPSSSSSRMCRFVRPCRLTASAMMGRKGAGFVEAGEDWRPQRRECSPSHGGMKQGASGS